MKHNRELPLYGVVAAAFTLAPHCVWCSAGVLLAAVAIAYGLWMSMAAALRTIQAALGAIQ